MRALAKLVATNNPDKIIFVGEALVGNEAVDQLTKFDRALKDFSASGSGTGQGRGIDGMLVTKWDTVDDKVRFRIISISRDRFADFLRALQGRCGTFNDICDWAANSVRRLRPGQSEPGTHAFKCADTSTS